MKTFLLFFLVSSCAGLSTGKPTEGKSGYNFTDVTGTYRLNREHKVINKKLVTRTQLFSGAGSSKNLEKSINVAHLGSIKQGKNRLLVLRPEASDFTVWLDGKKYSSNMRINTKNKTLQIKLDSPESKWQGTREVPFPKAKNFCFYSQIPDCLYHNMLLTRAMESKPQKMEFYVIWDNWPYMQEQLTNIGSEVFASASVSFEGPKQNTLRFLVEVEDQMLLYHFSKSFDLVRMNWIAQGITVAPLGESPPTDIE